MNFHHLARRVAKMRVNDGVHMDWDVDGDRGGDANRDVGQERPDRPAESEEESVEAE